MTRAIRCWIHGPPQDESGELTDAPWKPTKEDTLDDKSDPLLDPRAPMKLSGRSQEKRAQNTSTTIHAAIGSSAAPRRRGP